jgi:hypothetical protein
MRRLTVILAAGALAAACSSSDPTGTPTSQLHFLRVAATAPPYANAVDSFWAVKGQSRTLRIYFQPEEPGEDSAQLLAFSVPAQALLRRPDGSTIAPGDSVLIHVSVLDPVHMIVAFEPAGLQFSPTAPAHLTFDFTEADADINDDGQVNATDDSLKAMLHLWRQETATAPWMELLTTVNVTSEQADADILGFTNYALAY